MKKYIVALLLLGSCISEAGISVRSALTVCGHIERRYKNEISIFDQEISDQKKEQLVFKAMDDHVNSMRKFPTYVGYYEAIQKDIRKINRCLKSKIFSKGNRETRSILIKHLEYLRTLARYLEINPIFISETKSGSYLVSDVMQAGYVWSIAAAVNYTCMLVAACILHNIFD